jgi:hypothetical protein
VTYKKYDTFIQVGGENISEVSITNINPALLGSIMQAGGTAPELVELMFPILLSEVRTIFKEEFSAIMAVTLTEDGLKAMLVDTILDLIPQSLIDLFGEEEVHDFIAELIEIVGNIVIGNDSIMSMLVNIMGNAMPDAEPVFLAEWANDYFPKVDIDLTILFDNLKIQIEKWLPWYLDRIADWIIDQIAGSSIVAAVEDMIGNLIQDIGAGMVDDAGGPAHQGVDIDGREPYNFPGATADLNISMHSQGGSGLTFEQSSKLWDKSDPLSLTGFDYVEEKIWFEAIEDKNSESYDALIDHFGIEEYQLDMILNWIVVGCDTWAKNAGGWTLNDWNAGLVVTRYVEEWLFTANDTAVYNHQAYYNQDLSLAEVGIFDNCHNEAEAEEADVPSIKIKTGRDDINKVGQCVEYNGQRKINLWNEPVKVGGTDGTQFAPGVTKDDTLEVFSLDMMRVVEMEYDKEVELYDINLLKFELSEETFEADPMYFMNTDGLVNLAPLPEYRNVPVRISQPHFLDADSSVQSAVAGMNPEKSEHGTYICVEPISGITMKARQRAQVNLEIGPMDCWYENIPHAAMPILWMEDSGEIPEDLANEFREQVYPALELKERVPLLCLGIGAALCVPGVAVSTTQSEKRKRKKISEILPKNKAIAKKQMLMKSTNSQDIEKQVSEIRMKLGLNTEGLENIEGNEPKND